MIGKIRLGASPRRNHGWNIPFHVTGRGITTRPMGADPIFTIDFDFLNHRLDINTTDGQRQRALRRLAGQGDVRIAHPVSGS